MANEVLAVIAAHQTIILLGIAWNFSAWMSAMPPLDPNAGYWTRWIHDYLQIVAANLNKRTTAEPKL